LNSILQTEKECFVCRTTLNLHCHHVFEGANRHWSEQYGMKVWLCAHHHNMSDDGVHNNPKFNLSLKRYAQRRFEEKYSHEEFMKIFGKNYL